MLAIYPFILSIPYFTVYIVCVFIFHRWAWRVRNNFQARFFSRKHRYDWNLVNKEYGIGIFAYYTSSIVSIIIGMLFILTIKLQSLSIFYKSGCAIMYLALATINFHNFANLQISQILYIDSCMLVFNWYKKRWTRFRSDSIDFKYISCTYIIYNIVFRYMGKRNTIYCVSDSAFIRFISNKK